MLKDSQGAMVGDLEIGGEGCSGDGRWCCRPGWFGGEADRVVAAIKTDVQAAFLVGFQPLRSMQRGHFNLAITGKQGRSGDFKANVAQKLSAGEPVANLEPESVARYVP